MVIRLFRKHYHGFPKGRIKVSESPDFILNIGRKSKIGIEITQLHPFDINPENLTGGLTDIRKINREILQRAVNKKNNKASMYLGKKLNELWLIIYVDGFSGPESYNFRNKIEKITINSLFTRLFLFDLFNSSVFELNNSLTGLNRESGLAPMVAI